MIPFKILRSAVIPQMTKGMNADDFFVKVTEFNREITLWDGLPLIL